MDPLTYINVSDQIGKEIETKPNKFDGNREKFRQCQEQDKRQQQSE